MMHHHRHRQHQALQQVEQLLVKVINRYQNIQRRRLAQ